MLQESFREGRAKEGLQMQKATKTQKLWWLESQAAAAEEEQEELDLEVKTSDPKANGQSGQSRGGGGGGAARDTWVCLSAYLATLPVR
jgi:hypothetical protein